jgi:hypothetical protein
MYEAVLLIHSWFRWVVIVLALVGLVRAVLGSQRKADWSSSDERVIKLFVIAVDVQFLIGLTLFAFLSPSTHHAFYALGPAMRNSDLRFWTVEHELPMLAAVAVAHIGRVRGKRYGKSPVRHRAALVTYAVFLGMVALGFPWPGTSRARPLFRFGP